MLPLRMRQATRRRRLRGLARTERGRPGALDARGAGRRR